VLSTYVPTGTWMVCSYENSLRMETRLSGVTQTKAGKPLAWVALPRESLGLMLPSASLSRSSAAGS
jgi:hypothetical protein